MVKKDKKVVKKETKLKNAQASLGVRDGGHGRGISGPATQRRKDLEGLTEPGARGLEGDKGVDPDVSRGTLRYAGQARELREWGKRLEKKGGNERASLLLLDHYVGREFSRIDEPSSNQKNA